MSSYLCLPRTDSWRQWRWSKGGGEVDVLPFRPVRKLICGPKSTLCCQSSYVRLDVTVRGCVDGQRWDSLEVVVAHEVVEHDPSDDPHLRNGLRAGSEEDRDIG